MFRNASYKYTEYLNKKNHLGQGPLLQAIAAGDMDALDELIKQHDLNETDTTGKGAMLTAVAYNQTKILRKLTTPRKRGGYGLSLDVTDHDGNNAVLIAAAKGYEELFRSLTKSSKKDGFGLSKKSKNRNGNNALIIAISNNQKEFVKTLIAKKKHGGFGFSLKTKNNFGSGPILSAVGSANIEMLSFLTAAKTDGGLELPIHVTNRNHYGPIEMAVINDRADMLELLTTDQNNNGYGFVLKNIETLIELAKTYSCTDSIAWLVKYEFDTQLESSNDLSYALTYTDKILAGLPADREVLEHVLSHRYKQLVEISLKKTTLSSAEMKDLISLTNSMVKLTRTNQGILSNLFIQEFNQKLHTNDYKTAVAWIMDMFAKLPVLQNNFKNRLRDRFLQLIESETSPNQNSDNIQILIDATEELAPNEGLTYFAKLCMEKGDFENAYNCYLALYSTSDCSALTKEDIGFELANLIFNNSVSIDFKDADESTIMRKRIETARQYLENNNTDKAQRLAYYFDRILNGKTTVKINKPSVTTVSLFSNTASESETTTSFTATQTM